MSDWKTSDRTQNTVFGWHRHKLRGDSVKRDYEQKSPLHSTLVGMGPMVSSVDAALLLSPWIVPSGNFVSLARAQPISSRKRVQGGDDTWCGFPSLLVCDPGQFNGSCGKMQGIRWCLGIICQFGRVISFFTYYLIIWVLVTCSSHGPCQYI